MSAVAATIAKTLKGKRVGAGYLVPCPAHEDNNPSLSISDGDKGLMVHCFAGCAPRDVYAALHKRKLVRRQCHATTKRAQGSVAYQRQQQGKAVWMWSLRWPITAAAHLSRAISPSEATPV